MTCSAGQPAGRAGHLSKQTLVKGVTIKSFSFTSQTISEIIAYFSKGATHWILSLVTHWKMRPLMPTYGDLVNRYVMEHKYSSCAITITMTRTHGVLRIMHDLKYDHTSLQNTITSGHRSRVMVLEGHVVILGHKSCIIPHK